MGRCPMLVILAVQVAIILLTDLTGYNRPQQPPAYGSARYSAMVLSSGEAGTSGQLIVTEIDSIEGCVVPSFNARVHVVSETPVIYPGQRLSFRSAIRPLPDVPPVPDIIDLQQNLRRRGVVATAVVPVDSICYIATAHHPREWFAHANEYLSDRLRQAPLDDGTIDILLAMLLGHGDMVPEQTRAGYSAAGLSHVLALSGLHVGIIAALVALVLWPFYLGRHVRTRLLLTITALWFYAALTAFIPSVTRAVVMASVYMIGKVLQRKSSPINSLCLAAIVILAFSPEEIYSAGFQLSFSAVFGIIMLYPLINRVDRQEHPLRYGLVSYPALSVSAMAFAGIVSAYHFHIFPVYFLLANLLIVPIVPLLLASGILSMTFNMDFGADFMCSIMNRVTDAVAALPHAAIGGLYPPAWLVVLLMVILTMLAVSVAKEKKFHAIVCGMFLAAALICCNMAPAPVYPDEEVYEVAENRSAQTIVASGDSCFIYTDASLPAERSEIEERYRVMLRDFVAKRKLAQPILK